MAVTLADIKKLRDITGAGMMDVKKALEEANGDFDVAKDLLRKRGQAIAAKRSEREASEGCVLAKAENGFGAIVAVKCETDFVAKNEDYVNMVKAILEVAMTEKPADIEALKACKLGDFTVADAVTERSGVTGEKMELGMYEFVNGEATFAYIHPGNRLASVVAFNQKGIDEQVYKDIAMQIAAMNPVAVDEAGVSAEVIEKEKEVAIEKTKQDQIAKAVEVALKKAGINPAHVDSEDHIESNMAKGWITAEDAAKAREIKEKVAAEKAESLPAQMIENIVKGRIAKFFKECTLLEQAFIKDQKASVADYLKSVSKDLTVTSFKRITLNQE